MNGIRPNPDAVLAIAALNALQGDATLLRRLVTPTLTELHQKALEPVIRNIREGHNCSGGDFSYGELLMDEAKQHNMSMEEIAYIRGKLGI